MNKKTLLAIAIVCLGYVFPMQAQKIENFTLQGSKGKLAATLQAPKLKSGEKVRLVVI